MPATTEQHDWIKLVLGIDVSAAGHKTTAPDGGPGAAIPTVRIWNDAKDRVDQQLNVLYGVLNKTGIPVLAEVAGQIEGALENYRVGLIDRLMDYDSAAGATKEKARAAALSAVAQYQKTLADDPYVKVADTNPFGVGVTARTTLGAALADLQGQLALG